MRLPSGQPQPLMPWITRQRRWSVFGGATLGIALAALLIVRVRSIALDPTVEMRLTGSLAITDPSGPAFTFTLDDGSDRPIALLGVAFVPSHRSAAIDRVREMLASDATALLTFDPALRQTPDAAGRWRAFAYLPDGRMINEVLIGEGLAKADRSLDHIAARSLGQIESLARRRELGTWAE